MPTSGMTDGAPSWRYLPVALALVVPLLVCVGWTWLYANSTQRQDAATAARIVRVQVERILAQSREMLDRVAELATGPCPERLAELQRNLVLSHSVGTGEPLPDHVVRLVLATKSHKVAADDVNAAVLSDADLSVLGAPALRYRQYADAVREEYVSVPDDVFRSARARVLAALLDGPIFHTEVGRERWEEQARRNVGEEVSELNS